MSTRLLGGALLAALLLCAAAVAPARAASFEGGDEVLVAEGETIQGNLYVGGNRIRIAGTIDGDLICGGTQVEVLESGRITGDLMCGAQSIVVDGEVEGDIRSAGFTLRVGPTGRVGGEFLGAGFSLELLEGSRIGNDVLAAGAQGLIGGDVAGDLRFSGAALELGGQVTGDVEAEVGGSEDGDLEQGTMWTQFMPAEQRPEMPERFAKPGLTVVEGARIGGDLSYRAPEEAALPSGVVGGATDFEQIVGAVDTNVAKEPDTPAASVVAWLLGFLRKLISLSIVGLVLAWLAPRLLMAAQTEAWSKPLPSASVGLLTLILTVIGLVTLTLGTIFSLIFLGAIHIPDLLLPLLSASGLIFTLLTAGMLLLTWTARVVIGVLIGRFLLEREGPANRYAVLLAGLFVFALLASLPWIGGLLDLAAMLVGLGAIAMWFWRESVAPRLPGQPGPAPLAAD